MARSITLSILGCVLLLAIVAYFLTLGMMVSEHWIALAALLIASNSFQHTTKRLWKLRPQYDEMMRTGARVGEVDWLLFMTCASTMGLALYHAFLLFNSTLHDIWDVLFCRFSVRAVKDQGLSNPYSKTPVIIQAPPERRSLPRFQILEVMGVGTIAFTISVLITFGYINVLYSIIAFCTIYFAHIIYFTIRRLIKQGERFNKSKKSVNPDFDLLNVLVGSIMLSAVHFFLTLLFTAEDIFYGQPVETSITERIENPYEKPPAPPPAPVLLVYRGDPHVTTYRMRKSMVKK